MPSITVVKPEDSSRLTEIGELTALAYLADGLVDAAHPYVPQLKDAGARAAHATLLMMTDGDDGTGRVIGTITVVPHGSKFSEIASEGEFELRMLAVSPMDRGRGIGKELARAGMQAAIDEGARRIVLSTMESMESAHRLYDKLGFVRDESLDWTVYDTDRAGERVESEEAAAAAGIEGVEGVKLLGFTWTPPSWA